MPNRIIKESIHTSESVNAMTDFQFRLWVSLITYVDDYGRGDARPAVIKGSCFPLRAKVTAKEITTALNALANIGCIRLYESNGKPYFFFPEWGRHQTTRAAKSKYPDPESGKIIENSNLKLSEINCMQEKSNVSDNRIRDTNSLFGNRDANKPRFTPPTLEEVRAYCRERNSPVDPVKFWEYFNAGGWKDAKGQPVRSWKQKLLTWEKYDKAPNAANTSYSIEPAKSDEENDKEMKALLASLTEKENNDA